MDKIKFYQVRDLGDLLSDTFRFLTQHNRTFWKLTLTYVLPAYLVVALISVVLFKDMYAVLKSLQTFSPTNQEEMAKELLTYFQDFFMQPTNIILSLVIFIASIVLFLYRSILPYFAILEYNEKGEDSPVHELHLRVMQNIGKYFLYLVLLFLCAIPMMILFGIMIQVGIIGWIIMICFIFYIVTLMTTFFPVVFLENTSFTAGFGRLTKLIDGRYFWMTLLLWFLVLVGSVVLTFVISLIGGVAGILGVMAGLVFSQVLSTVGTFMLGIYSSFLFCFNYASIRTELEGAPYDDNNNDLIDQIGDFKQ